MNRRRLMTALFGTGALGVAASPARATAVAPALPSAVYHLDEVDKINGALGNMRNHIAGMDGPANVRLAMVVLGPALASFRADAPDRTVATSIAALQAAGVSVFACINTMHALHLTLPDLLPGFAVAEKGGVVKLAELQMQGWAYLRP